MAKQGTITAPSGSDLNLRTLGDATPTRATLGGIMREAFSIAVATVAACINLVRREVTIVSDDVAAQPIVTAAGILHLGTLTKDDGTLSASPWTFSPDNAAQGLADLVNAVLGERKPSYSVESLIAQIEDKVAADPTIPSGQAGIIVMVDQANMTVEVFGGTLAAAQAVDGAAVSAELAQFNQTLDAAGGAQFGE